MATPQPDRIHITLQGREVQHNGGKTHVAFRLGRISVGCTDVDTNAAEFLLAEYRKAFPPAEREVVLQGEFNDVGVPMSIRPDDVEFYLSRTTVAAGIVTFQVDPTTPVNEFHIKDRWGNLLGKITNLRASCTD